MFITNELSNFCILQLLVASVYDKLKMRRQHEHDFTSTPATQCQWLKNSFKTEIEKPVKLWIHKSPLKQAATKQNQSFTHLDRTR